MDVSAKLNRQKRIPKGHTGGGRWTSGEVPPSIKDNSHAVAAYKMTRQATAARIKAYKTKRKLATATGDKKKALEKQYNDEMLRYRTLDAKAKSLRAIAKKNGVKLTSDGKVVLLTHDEKINKRARREPPDIDTLAPDDFAKLIKESSVWKMLDDDSYKDAPSLRSVRKKLLEDIHSEYGFDKTPNIVDKIDGDDGKYMDVVYRGIAGTYNNETFEPIPGSELSNQFRYGKLYIGDGIYGDGTYATTRKNTADSYSGGLLASIPGDVLTIGIPKHARYVDYDRLDSLLRGFDMPQSTPTDNGLSDNQKSYLVKSYPEIAALALGYDGIKKRLKRPDRENEIYYVIFNRGQLDVEK